MISELFANGGLPMAGLFALSIALYSSLCKTLLTVTKVRRHCRRNHPTPKQGTTYSEMRFHFRTKIQKRLRFSRVLTVAAPLLGLLGTVMGMLNTFQVLSEEKSADTATSVAEGISMALVTTQAGLMVALPALFLTGWIKQLTQRSELMLFPSQVAPKES